MWELRLDDYTEIHTDILTQTLKYRNIQHILHVSGASMSSDGQPISCSILSCSSVHIALALPTIQCILAPIQEQQERPPPIPIPLLPTKHNTHRLPKWNENMAYCILFNVHIYTYTNIHRKYSCIYYTSIWFKLPDTIPHIHSRPQISPFSFPGL